MNDNILETLIVVLFVLVVGIIIFTIPSKKKKP